MNTLLKFRTKLTINIFILFLCSASAYCQVDEIKVASQWGANLFINYHAGLAKANKESGFDVDRARLSYSFTTNTNLSGKASFEYSTTKLPNSDLERVGNLKYAMLSWEKNSLEIDFGLIGLEQFNLQENFWGYRYVAKSFQDEFNFGQSADAGILAKYKFSKWLSADFSITNGEGYKHLNKDNKYRYEGGITITPINTLFFRAYFDIYSHPANLDRDQQVIALFAGYKGTLMHVGLEYNRMLNACFIANQHSNGFSTYASFNLTKATSIFTRFDQLDSNKEWNIKREGQQYRAGLQFYVNRLLKISPNFSIWHAKKGATLPYVYLNTELKI